MILVEENDKTISVQHDSILDLIDSDCPSKNEENISRFISYKERVRGQSWFGPTCTSAKEVIRKSLLGDKELYEKYLLPKISLLREDGEVKEYSHYIKKVGRKRTRGYQGDEVDIHRVYQGNLDRAWSKTERAEVCARMPLVTIFIQYSDSCEMSAVDSLWSASVAVKIFEELEAAGKSVQIMVGSAARGSSNEHDKIVTEHIVVKKFNQSLSNYRLAAISHLGAFRVFGFLGLVSQEYETKNSLGRSVSIEGDSIPIRIAQEINAGHTKLVVIGRSNTLDSAKRDLRNCYDQLKEFSQ